MHFCSFASHILKIKPVTAANSIFLFCFLSMSCNKIKIKNSSCTDVLFFPFLLSALSIDYCKGKEYPHNACLQLTFFFLPLWKHTIMCRWACEWESARNLTSEYERKRQRERWKWRVVSVKQSFFSPFTLENPSARLVVINLISPHYKSYEII